jgi:hypothetical protein
MYNAIAGLALGLLCALPLSASAQECRRFDEAIKSLARNVSDQGARVGAVYLSKDQTKDFLAAGIKLGLMRAISPDYRPAHIGIFIVDSDTSSAYIAPHDAQGCEYAEPTKIPLKDAMAILSESSFGPEVTFSLVYTGWWI